VSRFRKGNQALSGLKTRLREMPRTLAQTVAQNVAPTLTDMSQAAYGGARTVYGEARPKGVEGQPLDLHESGRTRETVRFTATGRIVRAKLGTPWAPYLIGKYRILPNGPLPVEWKRKIDAQVHAVKGRL
jgi:hypothetical protein